MSQNQMKYFTLVENLENIALLSTTEEMNVKGDEVYHLGISSNNFKL